MQWLLDSLYFIKDSHHGGAKFIRYGLIGGSAAVLDFSVFFVCFKLLLAISYSSTMIPFHAISIANTLGILSGFVWGFFMQKKWAFQADGRTQSQFVYTTLLLIFNILVSSWAIYPLSEMLNGNASIAKLVMQVLVVFWNYFIYSYFIFKAAGVVNEK
ncbi:GtrA family protein [Deefgea rivuli]|uniref:GtrA family protein n=1 Tax=Deefgea rivuli TaxID=400948 RepID=UPI0004802006|nr:GtrA family protein [Deefgea rivuli]